MPIDPNKEGFVISKVETLAFRNGIPSPKELIFSRDGNIAIEKDESFSTVTAFRKYCFKGNNQALLGENNTPVQLTFTLTNPDSSLLYDLSENTACTHGNVSFDMETLTMTYQTPSYACEAVISVGDEEVIKINVQERDPNKMYGIELAKSSLDSTPYIYWGDTVGISGNGKVVMISPSDSNDVIDRMIYIPFGDYGFSHSLSFNKSSSGYGIFCYTSLLNEDGSSVIYAAPFLVDNQPFTGETIYIKTNENIKNIDNENWKTEILTPAHAGVPWGREFGTLVVASGDHTRIVTSSYEPVGDSGKTHLHVFDRGPSGYVYKGEITSQLPEYMTWYTQKLAISGDGKYLFMGYYSSDNNSTAAIVVFKKDDEGDGWTEYSHIQDPVPGEWIFGYSFATNDDGSKLIVSTYNNNMEATYPGYVYLFERTGELWGVNKIFDAPSFFTDILMELVVDINGDGTRVLIGSPFEEVNGNTQAGKLKTFTVSNNVWTEEATFVSSEPYEYTKLGASRNFWMSSVKLAKHAPYLVAGLPYDNYTGLGPDSGFDSAGSFIVFR